MTLLESWSGHRASTDPFHADPELRGRTYAIPFHTVWEAALRLASGGLAHWGVVESDDQSGLIRAESRISVVGTPLDILIRIGLDGDGQTRVDMTSSTREDKRDLGANRRRVVRFFAALDRAVSASPANILVSSAGGEDGA